MPGPEWSNLPIGRFLIVAAVAMAVLVGLAVLVRLLWQANKARSERRNRERRRRTDLEGSDLALIPASRVADGAEQQDPPRAS